MRLFLFGVDGLTFRILDPLMERGLLPNFQRLQDGGARAILRSTTPPLTPPAWMSISTGMAAAKHGVYDFWTYEQTEHGPRAQVMTHRKGGKAMWNVLSEMGKYVVVANVPLTYPPEAVNGIMLSGYMAPHMHAGVTYPTAFREELLEAVPGYQIDLDPAIESGQAGDALAETLKMTHERVAMLRLLLQKPWEFFFIVFTGADRIQHARWPQIMAFHPQAVAYYQQVDEALGMVMEALHAGDVLMVVSDHGFQGIQRQFYIQEYLHKQGLLRLKDEKAQRSAELRNFAVELSRKALWAMKLQGVPTFMRRQCYRAGIKPLQKGPLKAKMPDLDWANTHAWLQSASGDLSGYADIFLQETLTEEHIAALAAALLELRDPLTGKAPVVEVQREDAFGSGPFAPRERHLLLIAGENIALRMETGMKNLWNTCRPYGIHHPDGIVYFYGAGVKKGKTIHPAHVYDIAPTVLACMRAPLPREMDGKVIAEAFEHVPSGDERVKENGRLMQKLRNLTVHRSENR
ncbi:MAG: alkaline phosphatase family protein [Ktedonobacteraceae bacterium]